MTFVHMDSQTDGEIQIWKFQMWNSEFGKSKIGKGEI